MAEKRHFNKMARLFTVGNVKNSTVCRYQGPVDSYDERLMRPLSFAEAALYRREDWSRGEKKARRARWEGERGEPRHPPFPSSHLPPRAFYLSIIDIFIWDTQRKPRRRRDLCAQGNEKLILELAQPNKENITTTLPLIQTDFS